VTLRDVERYRGVKANHLDLNITRRKLRESTASLISTIALKGYYDELLSAALNVSSDFTAKSAEELDMVIIICIYMYMLMDTNMSTYVYIHVFIHMYL
jgi:hypothetical protein